MRGMWELISGIHFSWFAGKMSWGWKDHWRQCSRWWFTVYWWHKRAWHDFGRFCELKMMGNGALLVVDHFWYACAKLFFLLKLWIVALKTAMHARNASRLGYTSCGYWVRASVTLSNMVMVPDSWNQLQICICAYSCTWASELQKSRLVLVFEAVGNFVFP